MCRLLVYKGRQMFMSDLLTKSEQSLILQSYKARERKEPLNGDGFGVGWYDHDIDPIPCVFTSTRPAWSDRNLFHLSEKIRSTCFFAHVRAASRGSYVSQFNCHPFQCKQFLWMQNGKIADFPKIKRRVRDSLDDEYYNFIKGTTDTEHTFALFLNLLAEHLEDYSIGDLRETLIATIPQLNSWTEEAGVADPSYYNFAITDGQSVIATRYVTNTSYEAPSLYISQGERFEHRDGKYHMIATNENPYAVIIASEPLTEDRSCWKVIPQNHIVTVTPEFHIHTQPID